MQQMKGTLRVWFNIERKKAIIAKVLVSKLNLLKITFSKKTQENY